MWDSRIALIAASESRCHSGGPCKKPATHVIGYRYIARDGRRVITKVKAACSEHALSFATKNNISTDNLPVFKDEYTANTRMGWQSMRSSPELGDQKWPGETLRYQQKS